MSSSGLGLAKAYSVTRCGVARICSFNFSTAVIARTCYCVGLERVVMVVTILATMMITVVATMVGWANTDEEF